MGLGGGGGGLCCLSCGGIKDIEGDGLDRMGGGGGGGARKGISSVLATGGGGGGGLSKSEKNTNKSYNTSKQQRC